MSIIKQTMVNLRSGKEIGNSDDLTFGYSKGNRNLVLGEVLEYFNELNESTIVKAIKTIIDSKSTLTQLINAYRTLSSELNAKYSGKELEAIIRLTVYGVTVKASVALKIFGDYVDSNIMKNVIIKEMLKSSLRELDIKISNSDTYHEALDILEVVRFLSDYTYKLDEGIREQIYMSLTAEARKALATGKPEYSSLRNVNEEFKVFSGNYREPIKRILESLPGNEKGLAKKALDDFENAVRPSTSYSIIDEVIYDSGIFETIK